MPLWSPALPGALRRVSAPVRVARLRQALAGLDDPAIADLRRITLIARANGISEFEAVGAAGAVTILRITREDPDLVAHNIHFAYENLFEHMRDPAYGVPEPLALFGEQGIVVTRRPEGPVLSDIVPRGGADDAIGRGAAWLRALHDGFEPRPGAFDAGDRIRETVTAWEAGRAGGPDPMEPVAARAMDLSETFEGSLVEYVKFHRAFEAQHVILGERVTWTKGIVNTRRRPRMHDLAHYLVDLAFLMPSPSGRDDWGLPGGLRETACEGYGLVGKDLERQLEFAVMTRMIEVYEAGLTARRSTARFRARKRVLLDMARAVSQANRDATKAA
ncbi:MAG: hypothetical protein ACPGID_07105 [Rubricella sp.]